MQTYIQVIEDKALQAELKAAYENDELNTQYQDGTALVTGDVFTQVKQASCEDSLVFFVEQYELQENFEQLNNTNCDLLEDAKPIAQFYLAEFSHITDMFADLMRKQCGM